MNFEVIEVGGDSELSIICELAREIWPEVFDSMVPPEQVQFMLETGYTVEALQRARAAGEAFHLVYLDGEVTGYLALTNYGDGHGKLNKIYLRSNARGLGLGRKLLEFAVNWGRERNLEYMLLNVNQKNERALNAYKALGWTHYRDEIIDIGRGFICNDHIMRIDL